MPACAVCVSGGGDCASGGGGGHTCGRDAARPLRDLPRDLLLTVMGYLSPADVVSLERAAPWREVLSVTRDTLLWRAFFARDFGPATPPHLYITAGAADWQRAYAESRVRDRRLRALRIAGNGFRPATAHTAATAAAGVRPTPARISVTQEGNMYRVRSRTADEGATPVVVTGRVARFDWSRR